MILLIVIGPTAFKLNVHVFRSLVAPEKLDDNSYMYSDLVEVMMKHHNLKHSGIVHRYKFNSQLRPQEESILTFMSKLRALAEFCNYGTSLDTMLRDRYVCGVSDWHVLLHLLSEPDLTLNTTMQIVLGMETPAQNAKTLQQQPRERCSSSLELNQVVVNSKCRRARCGKPNHHPSKYRSRMLSVTTAVKWDI